MAEDDSADDGVFDETPVEMPEAPEGAAEPDPAPVELTEEYAPLVPAAAEPAEPAEPAAVADELAPTGPRKLRLWAEGVGVFILGLVMAVVALPGLQDSKQDVYEELMTQAFGPDRHGLGRMLKDGFIPTWTRYSFSGEPYAANTQHEVFYPLSWPFIFLKTSTALDLTIALHIAIAFVGAWAFLRIGLKTSMAAAVFAALSWGLSSQVLDHTVLGDQLDVLVWTPLLFLSVHLACQHFKVRWMVLTGFFIGIQFLGGHPEEWLYALGSMVLYAGAYGLFAGPARETAKRFGKSVVAVVGSVVAFVLLFGWQLWPTLQLKSQGFRNAGFDEQHPIPFLGGVNVLLPDYGKVLQGENVGFASIVALGLFGLFFGGGKNRWLKVYLGVAAALGFTMALGNQARYPQFYNFLYDHVSLIHQFRVPSRWLLLTCFALCVGGGLGVDVLLEKTAVRVRLTRAGFAVVTLAVFFGFAFLLAKTNNDGASNKKWALAAVAGVLVWGVAQVPWVPRLALAAALVVVAGFESVKARPHAEYNQKAPNVLLDDYGTLANTMAEQGGRALSIAGRPLDPDQLSTFVLPPNLTTDQERNYYFAAEPTKLDVIPNNNVAVGAEEIVGRDNGLLPLQRYKDFFDAAAGIPGNLGSGLESALPSGYNWQALDLMGLDWFLSNDIIPADERAALLAKGQKNTGLQPADVAALQANGFTEYKKDEYVVLWHRTAQPIFRIMHEVTAPMPNREDRIKTLSDHSFPLLTKAIVEKPVSVDPLPAGASETVGATTVKQTSVKTTVTLASKGIVVLSDPYYPGWEVTVDGKKQEMLAVDSAFRGVVVPAGTHTIEYTYHDTRLEVGAVVALVTIAGLVVYGIVGRRRRKDGTVETGDEGLELVAG